MRRALLISLLVFGAALAHGEDDLSAKTQDALDKLAKGDLAAVTPLVDVASREHGPLARKLCAMCESGPHAGHRAALQALESALTLWDDMSEATLPRGDDENPQCRFAWVQCVDALLGTRREVVARNRARVFAGLLGMLHDPDQKVLDAARETLRRFLNVSSHEKLDAAALAEAQKEGDELLSDLANASSADAPSIAWQIGRVASGMRELAIADAVAQSDRLLARVWSMKGWTVSLFDATDAKKRLRVSAVFVDPRPGSTNRAVVHVDGYAALYEERQCIHDSQGLVVEDLAIAKVRSDGVTFRLGTTEIEVPLRGER